MDKTHITLMVEPKDELYFKLVDLAVEHCAIALLVVRKSISLSPAGKNVLSRLEPHLMTKIESSEWPGTKLLDETAWVYRYSLSKECANILKETTNSVYKWIQPNLPEDLCFLKNNGDIWFASIAHEKDSFFSVFKEEVAELRKALPNIF